MKIPGHSVTLPPFVCMQAKWSVLYLFCLSLESCIPYVIVNVFWKLMFVFFVFLSCQFYGVCNKQQ